VLGLIVAFNKADHAAFTTKDEDILSNICSHVAIAMSDQKINFGIVLDMVEKSMDNLRALQYDASAQRTSDLFASTMQGIGMVTEAEATALVRYRPGVGHNQDLYVDVSHGAVSGMASSHAMEAIELCKVMNVGPDGRRSPESPLDSELCVPIFDTTRKCLGVIMCTNKQGGHAFTEADIKFVEQAASHISTVMEGPDAGLRRVLNLARQHNQQKDAIRKMGRDKSAVVCFVDRAENLPNNADLFGVGIDPYVTIKIVRGDPLKDQSGAERAMEMNRDRRRGRTQPTRDYAITQTVMQNLSPKWDAALSVVLPEHLRHVPVDELYLHLLLWDYDALKEDDLIAQLSLPLGQIRSDTQTTRDPKPYTLEPLPGQDGLYDLSKARIWLSVSRL
jgi:hypothetical protein